MEWSFKRNGLGLGERQRTDSGADEQHGADESTGESDCSVTKRNERKHFYSPFLAPDDPEMHYQCRERAK
jgi:hypothetical protein